MAMAPIMSTIVSHFASSMSGTGACMPGRGASVARTDPERPIDSIQFDPFHSPWSPKPGSASVGAATDQPTAAEQVSESPSTDEAAIEVPVETDDFRAAVDSYERRLLEQALGANRFNQRATAAAIGLSYDQLRHALKRHKLLDAGSR